jgi:DNA-binding response OmpR family regulator
VRLASAERFDLYILSEYTEDAQTGLEVCRHLRAFDQETPILFYSTQGSIIIQAEALGAGAQAYLVKPDGLVEMERVIGRLLKDAARRRCH